MSASRGAKALAIGVTTVVIASVIAGLIAIGSPDLQRKHKLDERRIADLTEIVRLMPIYWDKNKILPPSLGALASQPGLHLHLIDPETGVAYEYATTSEKSFRLCASFAEESADESPRVFYIDPHWTHGAGHQCFERKMSTETGGGRTAFE